MPDVSSLPWVSVGHVARRAGFTQAMLWRLIHSGGLPAPSTFKYADSPRHGGTVVGYPREAIDELLTRLSAFGNDNDKAITESVEPTSLSDIEAARRVMTSLPPAPRPLAGLVRDLTRLESLLANDPGAEPVLDLLRSSLDKGIESLTYSGEQRLTHEFARRCSAAGLQPVLAAHEIDYPIYNVLSSLENNWIGPWDTVPTDHAFGEAAWSLLGKKIQFPIGVPASILTSNEEWVGFYAERGFNVLTYKTVRSVQFGAHDFPHWAFLKDEPRSVGKGDFVTASADAWPDNFDRFSMVNSFGVPSPSAEVWQADVERCLNRLRSDQILIVSVMGTDLDGVALDDDFAVVARMAEEAGAEALELNLSCPNTLDGDGAVAEPLCTSVATAVRVAEKVRESVSVPIVAKLSHMPETLLRELITALTATELVQGVSGINTSQVPVRGPGGDEFFPGRDKAGLSGALIADQAKEFVRVASAVRDESRRGYDIIGMGGVMDPGDALTLTELGATAVQTATAAMVRPDLASDVVREYETIGTLREDPDYFRQLVARLKS